MRDAATHRLEAATTVNAVEAVDVIEWEVKRFDRLTQAHGVCGQPLEAAGVVAADDLRMQA
jgi:hypothetical protein